MITLLNSDLKLYHKGDLYIDKNNNNRVLLSHYMDDEGSHYLSKWCASNDRMHKCLFLRTSKLLAYFKKDIKFYELVEKASRLWLVEIEIDNLEEGYEKEVEFTQLEKDCMPLSTSIYNDNYTDYAKQLHSLLYDKDIQKTQNEGCIGLIAIIVFFILLFVLSIYLSSN
jgi:hypothetical protein